MTSRISRPLHSGYREHPPESRLLAASEASHAADHDTAARRAMQDRTHRRRPGAATPLRDRKVRRGDDLPQSMASATLRCVVLFSIAARIVLENARTIFFLSDEAVCDAYLKHSRRMQSSLASDSPTSSSATKQSR